MGSASGPSKGPAPASANDQRPDAAAAQSSARRSWKALKNWSVRSRLLLLVIIPALASVVLGGVRITSSVQSALTYQRVLQLANLNGKIVSLVQALQTERQDTITFITLGDNGGRAALSLHSALAGNARLELTILSHGDFAASSRLATQVESLLREVNTNNSGVTQQDVSGAIAAIDGLGPLRAAATGSRLPALVVIREYTQRINTLLVLDSQVAAGSNDSALAAGVRVADRVSAMTEVVSEEQALITASQSSSLIGLSSTGFTPDIKATITTDAAQQQVDEAQFNRAATASQRQLFDNALPAPGAAGAQAQVQQVVSLTPTASPGTEDPVIANAESSLYDVVTGLRSVEAQLVKSVIARSTTLRNNALINALISGLAILLALAVSVLATVVVGRSMIRPLDRLRAGALEIAGVRLPEAVRRANETDGEAVPQEVVPIDVHSIDEIGEVARSFDQVHREAIRLASDEAALRGNVSAMFVNLSRRSQSLVERQIRLIDDLEQGEQDPERLGNLFQMDHIATRMRRNSENLLVLAGYDVPERRTEPAALVDVLRAAVSEIEQYERITLNVQPGIAVRGPAVKDVVHLLAELAENATSFSAADKQVTVLGHLLNSGGVLLDITDQGLGMDPEAMAHANWRLDNPPVVDVAISRRMGLFVTARLAARHGIRVRLRPASRGGLTALVWLPDEVITQEWATPAARASRFEAPVRPPAGPRLTAGGGAAGTGLPGENTGESRQEPVLRTPVGGITMTGEDEGLRPGLDGPATSSFGLQTTQEQQGATIEPAVSAREEDRLPIFESVESDWFRRGRHSAGRPAQAPGVPATWSSPADEGWRAAGVAIAPVSGGTTGAGLPKRVPKANLVPGGVGEVPRPSPSAPSQPAARTRDRLASFQRGIRQARATAAQETSSGKDDRGT